jgi:hypothetical protein
MKSSISVTAKFCCHRNAPQIVTELHLPGPFCTESLSGLPPRRKRSWVAGDVGTRKQRECRASRDGESILYYGGGGQGNHLGGFYGSATLRAFGAKYRSSAIAQDRTGEVWVNGLMFGTPVRGDFEHCEVALFIGKNPWQSHSIPHARLTLRNIAKDPARADRHRPSAAHSLADSQRMRASCLASRRLQARPGRRRPRPPQHQTRQRDRHGGGR